jgi:hypothetical protein
MMNPKERRAMTKRGAVRQSEKNNKAAESGNEMKYKNSI